MGERCVESLAEALYSALYVDLPEIEYQTINWRPATKEEKKTNISGYVKDGYVTKKRRPYDRDVEVYHFLQTWGSTALGFGGIGGQAITNAYTTVVICHPCACVYFAGRFAYKIDNPNLKFMEHLQQHQMNERAKAGEYRSGEQAVRSKGPDNTGKGNITAY